MTKHTTQDNQSELREKLTCIMGGCIGSHENCLYETIEDAEIGSAEETKQMVDMQISLIEAYSNKKLLEGKIETAKHIKETMVSPTGGYCDEIIPNAIPDYIATLTQELEGSK